MEIRGKGAIPLTLLYTLTCHLTGLDTRTCHLCQQLSKASFFRQKAQQIRSIVDSTSLHKDIIVDKKGQSSQYKRILS